MSNALRRLAASGVATLAAAGAYKVIKSGLQPESQLFGPTLISGPNPSQWALTYDDGPNPRSTPELLDVLARSNVHATFFLVGKFVRGQAELVRRMHAAGHLIGNHTMTHPFLATKPISFVAGEIGDCTHLLEDTLGAPIRYFRAPYGGRRPGILRFLRTQDLTPVQWNAPGQRLGAHRRARHPRQAGTWPRPRPPR